MSQTSVTRFHAHENSTGLRRGQRFLERNSADISHASANPAEPSARPEPLTPLQISTLWEAFRARRAHHLSSFFTARECGVLLEYSNGAPFAPSIRARDLEICEKVLSGQDQTAIALELACSSSAVCAGLTRALFAMGFGCTGYQVPLFLMLIARPAVAGQAALPTSTQAVEIHGRICHLVLLPRPDANMSPLLSDAEAAVTRLLVEGASHAQIARLRGTSQRTIANQLGESFRKLQVSGRVQLMQRLVRSARY